MPLLPTTRLHVRHGEDGRGGKLQLVQSADEVGDILHCLNDAAGVAVHVRRLDDLHSAGASGRQQNEVQPSSLSERYLYTAAGSLLGAADARTCQGHAYYIEQDGSRPGTAAQRGERTRLM